MKYIFQSLFISFFVLGLLTFDASAQTLSDSLKAHFTFDNNLQDQTSNNNDLVIHAGTPGYNVFCGNDSYINFSWGSAARSGTPFDNSAFNACAISFWVRSSHLTRQIIIQGAFMGFGITTDNVGKVLAFFDYNSAGSLVSNHTVIDGKWHHVVAQNDGVATYMYVDGVFQGSHPDPLVVGNGMPNNQLYIAITNLGAIPFNGSLNELRIYNRMLLASEISQLSSFMQIKGKTDTNITDTACISYWSPSGKEWTVSGLYSDTLSTVCGDDSIINVDLTINKPDIRVLVEDGDLIALATGTNVQYGWINCASQSSIAGANTNTFTPTQNGVYAAVINNDGCIDTSACITINYVGNIEQSFTSGIQIYPNPYS